MLKDDPAHDSLICRTHVVRVGFDYLETRHFEPVLGLGVSLSAMKDPNTYASAVQDVDLDH